MKQRTIRVLMIAVFSLLFHVGSAESQRSPLLGRISKLLASNRIGSSIVLPLSGNVYPIGYYSVSLKIGNPPKAFDFDIDTGSDLTWVQCDAPCISCTLPQARLYRPNHNTVPCSDPLCVALHWPKKPQCKSPKDQCDYEVTYADHASSMGALVADAFPLELKNGSVFSTLLAFGCGYNQHFPRAHPPPPTAGVIGLGKGKISVLTQLNAHGITRNVIGHCLNPNGGGALFFGDDIVPSSGVSWTPMSRDPSDKHYSAGPAEILFDGKSTGTKDLSLIFDSGSSYSYFNSKAYNSIVNLIKKALKGMPLKDAKEDRTLPVCWKAAKPFKSVGDLKGYFKTIALEFASGRNIRLQIPPESYLIISKQGNACLGILNGAEAGLQNINIIGDIFMQGLMMIYDNEKQQIGWVSANCNQLR